MVRFVLSTCTPLIFPFLGLIGHLKNHFLPMYRLFTVLKNRKEPPTEEEILIASGKKVLDPATAVDYLRQLEHAPNTIVDAFNQQIQKAAVRASSCPTCYSSDLLYARVNGTRRCLRNSLPNGWLSVISHLKKWIDLNSSAFSSQKISDLGSPALQTGDRNRAPNKT
jgi:hypothetical protein